MSGPQPLVSVVIPVYNRAESLRRCLTSLFAQTYPHACFEILVVDDGSTDATAESARQAAASWNGSVSILSKPNGGPASARNAGLRAARGTIVAFTDSDCEADADWLDSLVESLDAEDAEDAAGVGGPITNIMPPGWIARYLTCAAFYRHRMRHGAVDYLLTANVAYRRATLLSIGGFSERAGAWGEDADLSFRLRQVGHRLLLAPRGTVRHYGAPLTVYELARELFRYGHGNAVLSRNWRNGRRPLIELARHGGAVVLAPLLALSHRRCAGLWRAISFWPLIVVEHTAFMLGLIHGLLRGMGDATSMSE